MSPPLPPPPILPPPLLPTPTPAKYTAAQLLSYSMFTFPGAAADGCSFDDHLFDNQAKPECYLGTADSAADAAARVEIMKHAVEKAYTSGTWERSASVLKIFMAPEFFFRGKYGAYNGADLLSGTVDVVNPLRAFAKDPRFEDWLFVFGTVIAVLPAGTERRRAQYVQDDMSEYWWYNLAPVEKGGPDGKSWLVRGPRRGSHAPP